MNKPSLNGTLGAVFRITGRGTVLIVENYAGDMPTRAKLRVGDFTSKIAGFDFPRKTVEKDDGSFDQDTSIIGLFVEEDAEEQLLGMKGQPVNVYEL